VGGMGCIFCFNRLHVRSLSFLLGNPTKSCSPFPKFSIPSQQCLNHFTEPGSPRVFARLHNLCVVCHSVNVYWLSFLLHITIPLLSVVHSTHIQTSALPLCRALVSRAEWTILPHLAVSREDSALDMPVACPDHKHWFIPPVRL